MGNLLYNLYACLIKFAGTASQPMWKGTCEHKSKSKKTGKKNTFFKYFKKREHGKRKVVD